MGAVGAAAAGEQPVVLVLVALIDLRQWVLQQWQVAVPGAALLVVAVGQHSASNKEANEKSANRKKVCSGQN